MSSLRTFTLSKLAGHRLAMPGCVLGDRHGCGEGSFAKLCWSSKGLERVYRILNAQPEVDT